MYLIEFFIKKWKENKKKKAPVHLEVQEREEELSQNCDRHLYMPIDSTCFYLACKNCGHLIRNDKGKKNKKDQDLFDRF